MPANPLLNYACFWRSSRSYPLQTSYLRIPLLRLIQTMSPCWEQGVKKLGTPHLSNFSLHTCLLARPMGRKKSDIVSLFLSPSKLQEWIKKFFILPPQLRVSQARQTCKLNIPWCWELCSQCWTIVKGVAQNRKSNLKPVSNATSNQTLNRS